MSLFQVILRKTITGIIRDTSGSLPEGGLTEEFAVNNADALWEELKSGDSIVFEDTEFMAMNEADWCCPECLADLKSTGKAAEGSITLADNATRPILEYGDLVEPRLVCSKSCGYELSEDEQRTRLAKIVG